MTIISGIVLVILQRLLNMLQRQRTFFVISTKSETLAVVEGSEVLSASYHIGPTYSYYDKD